MEFPAVASLCEQRRKPAEIPPALIRAGQAGTGPGTIGRPVGGRQRSFASWHFAMLNDEARNAAIERAIASLDLAGKRVLEIGSGAGLVALLLARHGAAHVDTCELNPELCDVARRVVAGSEHARTIRVLPCSSGELPAGGRAGETYDVIFTETLDCGVVGEGFFAIAADIKRLAAPGTVVLPGAIEQTGVLVDAPAMHRLNAVGTVCGFDLSVLNRYATRGYIPVRPRLYAPRALCAARTVRRYAYLDANEPAPVTLRVDRDGTAHGLLSWFTAEIGPCTMSNGGEESHWHQAFHPFATPLELRAGDEVRLQLEDDGVASVLAVDAASTGLRGNVVHLRSWGGGAA